MARFDGPSLPLSVKNAKFSFWKRDFLKLQIAPKLILGIFEAHKDLGDEKGG